MSSNSNTDTVFDVVATYLWLLALLGAFSWFFSVTGYQVYHWLQHAEWQPLPFSLAFEYLGFRLEFLDNPESWKGVAELVRWFLSLPLSIMVGLIVVLLAWLVYNGLRSQAPAREGPVLCRPGRQSWQPSVPRGCPLP